jgi:hypothetical protein
MAGQAPRAIGSKPCEHSNCSSGLHHRCGRLHRLSNAQMSPGSTNAPRAAGLILGVDAP